MDKLTAARQLRRAIEIFAESLQLDDERALEISGLYPAWQIGRASCRERVLDRV